MRETIEFRVDEVYASQHLPSGVGTRLGDSVRKVVVPSDDPLAERIIELNREFRSRGDFFFLGWRIRRTYSAVELRNAELVHLPISHIFEPTGEECGTVYDESAGCPLCGAGREQVSNLRLDVTRIPKSPDFAATIAGDEWVVSERVAELFLRAKVSGVTLRPVEHARPARKKLPVWYQPVPVAHAVEVAVPPTHFGNNPSDDGVDPRYRCPRGHTYGLNLLSELWVKRQSWDGSDFVVTKTFTGSKGEGLLRPYRHLLVSQRLWRLLKDMGAKGFREEVAHTVD